MKLVDAINAVSSWGPVKLTVVVFAAIAMILVGWALVEARAVQVSRATLSSPNLPPEFEGARVVFLADIHAGPFMSRARIRELVDRVNALEPDVVILGGDYVGGRAGGGRFFYDEIRRLDAPLGIYAVLGNHDYWEGVGQAKAGLERAQIKLLLNENVMVERNGQSIRIAGVDDAWIGDADASASAQGINADEFAVFVSHTPDYLPEALPVTRGTFDLALSGHTHGGQLTVFGLIAPLVPSKFGQRYRGGWLEEEGTQVLVTRGVGNVTLPVRFFDRPEINVIELKRGPQGIEN